MLSYPVLFTGGSSGSKSRGKKPRVDEMDEEYDPTMEEEYDPPVTKSKKAAPKKKVVGNKSKNLTASEMSNKDYTSLRKRDPYAVDRENLTPQFRGNNPFFYTRFQEEWYNEILHRKPNDNVLELRYIDIPHMERKPEYFGEALSMCHEFGIVPFITLQQNYDEALVCQFLATVYFGTEEPRYITWMTKDRKLTALWSDIGSMLGYEDFGPHWTDALDDKYFWVHVNPRPLPKDDLAPLYSWKRYTVGNSEGLYPPYEIMHRIYRETINPKVGNLDQIHSYLVTLMVMTHQWRSKGKKLDVMDYLWNEIWNVTIYKKNACFGPLIMKIILWKWAKEHPAVGLSDPKTWIIHKPKQLRVKDHSEKVKGSKTARGKDKAAVGDEGPSRAAKESGFTWMARQMKKVFGMSKALEKRSWEREEKEKRARQLDIQRRRDLGEQVASGSEKNIPTYE